MKEWRYKSNWMHEDTTCQNKNIFQISLLGLHTRPLWISLPEIPCAIILLFRNHFQDFYFNVSWYMHIQSGHLFIFLTFCYPFRGQTVTECPSHSINCAWEIPGSEPSIWNQHTRLWWVLFKELSAFLEFSNFPWVQNCPSLKELRCNSFKLRCNFQVHLWFNVLTWFGVQKPRSHFCTSFSRWIAVTYFSSRKLRCDRNKFQDWLSVGVCLWYNI